MTARAVPYAYLFTTYLIIASCWLVQIVTQLTQSEVVISNPLAVLFVPPKHVRPLIHTVKRQPVLFVSVLLFIIHTGVNCSSEPYVRVGVWGTCRCTSSHSEARHWMKFSACLDGSGRFTPLVEPPAASDYKTLGHNIRWTSGRGEEFVASTGTRTLYYTWFLTKYSGKYLGFRNRNWHIGMFRRSQMRLLVRKWTVSLAGQPGLLYRHSQKVWNDLDVSRGWQRQEM